MKRLMVIFVLLMAPQMTYAADAGAVDAQVAPASQPAVDAAVEPPTDTGPKDVEEAVGTAKDAWNAFKGGKYREGIAACIMLLIFLWRRFAAKLVIGKLSTWQVGLVAALLGFLGSIPEALAADPWSWTTFLWAGLATSGEAMLFWKTLGQKVLPKVFGEAPKE